MFANRNCYPQLELLPLFLFQCRETKHTLMYSPISSEGSAFRTNSRSRVFSLSAATIVAAGGKDSFGFSMNCNFCTEEWKNRRNHFSWSRWVSVNCVQMDSLHIVEWIHWHRLQQIVSIAISIASTDLVHRMVHIRRLNELIERLLICRHHLL